MKSITADWFEVLAEVEDTSRGEVKRVRKRYVFDAMSFTEAETVALEEISAYYNDVYIVDISRAKFREVTFSDNVTDELWVKAKIGFITINDNGVEKVSKSLYLIQCSSTEDAQNKIKELFNGSMSDYKVISVSESDIIDVLEHKKQESD